MIVFLPYQTYLVQLHGALPIIQPGTDLTLLLRNGTDTEQVSGHTVTCYKVSMVCDCSLQSANTAMN